MANRTPICSECGRFGDRMYADGSTTVARCPLHPHAKVYRVDRGRVDFDRDPGRLMMMSDLKPAPADGPHSRACGFRKHDHGPACNKNCPTCGGRR